MDREKDIRLLTSKGVDRAQAELIVRVKAGGVDGSRAADSLFNSQNLRLWPVLWPTLRNDADAEECLQRTMIEIVRGLHSFRGDSKFSSWCFTIARRTAIGLIRERDRDRQVFARTRQNVGSDDLGDIKEAGEITRDPDPSIDPEANARKTEFEKLLEECQERICRNPNTGQPDPLLQGLTEQWKRAFVVGAKTTAQDVADACCSDKDRAARARYALRNCLENKGVTRENLSGSTRKKR